MRSEAKVGLVGAGITAVIAAALAPGRRRPQSRGVHHAGVTVSDFEAAVRWYHEHFGFLLVTEMTLEGESADQLAALYGRTGLTVRFGFMRGRDGSILEVFQFDPPEPASPAVWNRPGYTHVAISVSDVHGWVRRLTERGVEFVTEPQFTAGAHWVFLRDPDGNLVELIDLHHNRLALTHLGGIVGRIHRRTRWAGYYR